MYRCTWGDTTHCAPLCRSKESLFSSLKQYIFSLCKIWKHHKYKTSKIVWNSVWKTLKVFFPHNSSLEKAEIRAWKACWSKQEWLYKEWFPWPQNGRAPMHASSLSPSERLSEVTVCSCALNFFLNTLPCPQLFTGLLIQRSQN